MVLTNTHWPGLAILHADLVLVYFATELHLKLQSVTHFYTTVVNTNHTLRPRNGQCTREFVNIFCCAAVPLNVVFIQFIILSLT